MSSHLDHHAAIHSRGSGAIAHFSGPSDELYQHVVTKSADGRRFNFPASQSSSLHASNHVSFFAPSTALPAIAPAQSQLDIRIPAGSCGAVTGISLRLDLENEGKDESVFGGVPNLFDRVEVWAEGGSQLIQRWTDDAFRISNHYLSRSQAEVYSKHEGVPSMIAGEERTVFLRLPFSFFESTHLNVASLSADLYVRLFFRGANSYDTAAYLTLNGAQAVVSWLAYPPTIQRALTARARSSTLDYRFFQNQFQKEILTLAANTRYSVRLSSMQGVVIQVALIIRPVGAVGTAISGGYVEPESYELLDSSGKSILGANILPFSYNHYEKQQQGLLNAFMPAFDSIESTLLIPLSPNVRGCLTKGVVEGYYVAGGYDSLAFHTDKATTGAHEITIVWQVAERIRKDGGRLSVHSS